MNTLEIGKALGTLLHDIDLHPFRAPEGTPYPFAAYALSGIAVATSKDRYNYREIATVDITTAADNYEDAVDLIQRIRAVLEPFEGDCQGIEIGGVRLAACRAASPSPGVYLHQLTYQIVIL